MIRILEDGSVAVVVWNGGPLLRDREEQSKALDSTIARGDLTDKAANARTVKLKKIHENVARRIRKQDGYKVRNSTILDSKTN